MGWDWVHLVCWPLTGLLYQSHMIDDYGAVGGMKICRGNHSTWRKPAPVPLCLPQIPHGLTWAQTQTTMVGSQWLTAWAMAQPRRRVPLKCQLTFNRLHCVISLRIGAFIQVSLVSHSIESLTT
jgi:hypothetical protein